MPRLNPHPDQLVRQGELRRRRRMFRCDPAGVGGNPAVGAPEVALR
nr:hypothetical protein [Rhodopirellula sp. SM50]